MDINYSWVVSANMGLGHQRATYPLRHLAYKKIFLFGEDSVSSSKEQRLWKLFRNSYEALSRTKKMPIIGPYLFNILDRLQNISPFYPKRDRSGPSLQVKSLYSLIKRGFGLEICNELSKENLPVITSFYSAAIAVEEMTDLAVYCIICDSDINRVWVAKKPEKSRIKYLVPCGRAMRRLRQYGVPSDRIFLTGFPLPLENIGDKSMHIIKKDLSERLVRLDPSNRFRIIHGKEAYHYLGTSIPSVMPEKPLTITYAVGGAGAQTEIAGQLVSSLKELIKQDRIKINLVAGVREDVYNYFINMLKKHSLYNHPNIKIVYNNIIGNYFDEFSSILHTTDLLWSKPSEISFYSGLGIPIIITPPIGPHEVANKQWLREIGAGIPQQDPRYCHEWITDYLIDGRLAQAAWDGFLYARKMGVFKIEEVLNTGRMKREISPVKR